MVMTDEKWPAVVLRRMYEEQMSALPYNGCFDLIEELPSGTLVNHLRGVSLDHLKEYVRMVFVDVAPPRFIFREVSIHRPSPPIEEQMFFDTDDDDDEIEALLTDEFSELTEPRTLFTFIKRLFQ